MKDAREWVKTFINCQTSKVNRHTESGVGDFPQPKRRFGHMHADVVGILPPSGSARYLLTIINSSTRWIEATPMSEATTHDGEPSPAEKVYGEALTVPGEFLPATPDDTKLNHLREISGKFRPCLKKYEDRTRHLMPKNLDGCDYVFIQVDNHCQSLTRPYRVPYKVIRRTEKSFLLKVHGQGDWVTIDRLKPAFLESNEKITARPVSPRILPQNKSSTKPEETTQRQKKTIPPNQSILPLRSSTRGELRCPLRYRDYLHQPSPMAAVGGGGGGGECL
ncbi:uncharacterized protein [Palaemon carinicauda]|uniref:uncharacterized protein n=1 Tax=Palaemon carinicauda TaxID=392227 RepID=UPI0035B6281B